MAKQIIYNIAVSINIIKLNNITSLANKICQILFKNIPKWNNLVVIYET